MRLRTPTLLAALTVAVLVAGLVRVGAAGPDSTAASVAVVRVAVAQDVTVAPGAAAPVRKAPSARRAPAAAVASGPLPVVAAADPVETPVVRGTRVLAALGYPWQALGYRVEFLPARDGLLGLTTPLKRLVQVFVSPYETDMVLAHSIAHEIGHVLDFTRATVDRRADYLRIRALADQKWFGCAECSDFATPAGDWAEVFASWLAGPGDFRSELAGAPTAAQLRALTPLFS